MGCLQGIRVGNLGTLHTSATFLQIVTAAAFLRDVRESQRSIEPYRSFQEIYFKGMPFSQSVALSDAQEC
jgi:hypothetical protein